MIINKNLKNTFTYNVSFPHSESVSSAPEKSLMSAFRISYFPH